jgi:type IV pilus assembly protein PilQ
MHKSLLPLAAVGILFSAPPCLAAPPPASFNLSTQKNVSAKDFIQDLATQAGLTVFFIERGQGRPAQTQGSETADGGSGSVFSGNTVLNTTSTTPGLANNNGGAKRSDIPLPSQFNLSFSNFQGGNALAQLQEVLDLLGLRAFRSRATSNVIYVSDKLSNPAQVAVRVRVLLVNDNLARERGISLGTGLASGAYDAKGNPVAYGRVGIDLGTGGSLKGGNFPTYSGLVGASGGSSNQESTVSPNLGNLGVNNNRTTVTLSLGAIVLQLQALEQVNALQTVLDQQIVVNDGETATLSQNIQFRIPQAVVSNGTVLNSTQAINARTTLNVTPVILPSKKQISISVRGDFSDPQGSGSDLVINTNSIDIPNLRLDSGGLALLSGITRHDESEVEYRVPVLSGIPLIGELFRSKSRNIRDQRLLIMVEPIIQDQPIAGPELFMSSSPVLETPKNLPTNLPANVQTPSPVTPLE